MDTLFSELFYNDGLAKSEQKVISLAADIITKNLYPREHLNEIVKELSSAGGFDWYGFSPAQGLLELISSIQGLLKRRISTRRPKKSKWFRKPMKRSSSPPRFFYRPAIPLLRKNPFPPICCRLFSSWTSTSSPFRWTKTAWKRTIWKG